MSELGFFTCEYLMADEISNYRNLFSVDIPHYAEIFLENGLRIESSVSMWQESIDAINISMTSMLNMCDSVSNSMLEARNNYNSANGKILKMYNAIMTYEKEYDMGSAELIRKWQENTLPIRNVEINDWIGTYLQVKDYIKK